MKYPEVKQTNKNVYLRAFTIKINGGILNHLKADTVCACIFLKLFKKVSYSEKLLKNF